MSTKRGKIDIPSSNQLSIFDTAQWAQQPPAPGSFNVSQQLRETITEALKRCALSRYGAAAGMSELLGVEITKSMLDAWTAESKDGHRFPAEYLPAFCQVTGCLEPLRILSNLLKCHLVESHEAMLVELARIERDKRDLARREKAIKDYINKAASR